MVKKGININIQKKDLWLLSAIMIFLIGVGYVVAYGGNQPSVMGHSIGELEGVQARVTGTCAVGSSIRVVNSDGTVGCETDDNTVSGLVTGGGNCGDDDEYPPAVWGTGFCSGLSPMCNAGNTVRDTGHYFSNGNTYYFLCTRN